MEKLSGKVIILTAPSGSGKTTLARYLLENYSELSFSVSATTRAPRAGEQNGVQYFFIDHSTFQQFIQQGKLFEYQEVYENQFYGTLHSELERIWGEGKIALFDIDVKGAKYIEESYPDNVLSIYVKASNLNVLKERLQKRATETPESIEKRLRKAKEELEYAKYFDYVITNDNLRLAQRILGEIVKDFILEKTR